MTRIFFLLLFVAIVCTGSSSCKQQNNTIATADSSSKEPLYPYPQYIREQIAYVDSMPLAIEKITIENGKQVDSTVIDQPAFKQLAQNFTDPDPNTSELRPKYTEESFNDLTINSLTFSITAKNTDLPLQQADVLLNPDTKKVRSVFLKKYMVGGDSSETRQLLWTHNMSFQISSFVVHKDGREMNRIVKVIWDRPLQ